MNNCEFSPFIGNKYLVSIGACWLTARFVELYQYDLVPKPSHLTSCLDTCQLAGTLIKSHLSIAWYLNMFLLSRVAWVETLILFNSLESLLNMSLLLCRLTYCLHVVASQKTPFSFKNMQILLVCTFLFFLFLFACMCILCAC